MGAEHNEPAKPEDLPLEVTAHHEAGHAVTGHRLGLYVAGVYLTPKPEARVGCGPPTAAGMFAEAVMVCAGMEAERRAGSGR